MFDQKLRNPFRRWTGIATSSNCDTWVGDRGFWILFQTKGELSNERKEKFESDQQAYQKLYANTAQFAVSLWQNETVWVIDKRIPWIAFENLGSWNPFDLGISRTYWMKICQNYLTVVSCFMCFEFMSYCPSAWCVQSYSCTYSEIADVYLITNIFFHDYPFPLWWDVFCQDLCHWMSSVLISTHPWNQGR